MCERILSKPGWEDLAQLTKYVKKKEKRWLNEDKTSQTDSEQYK